MGVDRLLDLEAHGRAEPTAHELALQRLEEVLGVVLLDLDVLVARDAEGVGLLDLHAREQGVQVRGDDVLERHEAGRADLHEARQQRRHLHAGEQLGAGHGVAHDDGQVERQSADVREGVRGVDGQRSEDREDLRVEEELDLGLLGGGELVPAEQLDALCLEVGQHDLAEQVGLLALQVVGALPDVLQHLAGRVPAGRPDRDAGGDAPLEAGDPDHEELVEVAGEDREELRPVEDGQLVVLGELEHALVEGEPRQLTVQEPVGGQPLLDGDGGGRRRERGGGARGRRRRLRRGHPTMVPQPDERCPRCSRSAAGGLPAVSAGRARRCPTGRSRGPRRGRWRRCSWCRRRASPG